MVRPKKSRVKEPTIYAGQLCTTKRWHMFNGESPMAFCGVAHWDDCIDDVPIGNKLPLVIQDWPADDLNYCQRCALVAKRR